jgi:hypothetical protein
MMRGSGPGSFPRLPAASTDAAARKRAYLRVLRIVRFQTSGCQPAGVRRVVVRRIAVRQCGLDADVFERAVRAAREHGDLVAYEDSAGVDRFVVRSTRALRSVIEMETERFESPDVSVVARLNRLGASTTGGDAL